MAEKKKKKSHRRYPLIEWISAFIGLAITGVLFGFLAYEAVLQSDGTPPVFEVVPTALMRSNGGFILEVRVENRSRSTGSAVQVEGSLKEGGQSIETSSASFDYVPGESHRRGGLVFRRDPREYKLELRVTGYERP